jgi:hypothetical protein
MRRAILKPYELVTGNDIKLFSIFYSLYLEKMRSFGTPPHSFRFFRAIMEAFGHNCMIFAVKDSAGAFVGAILYVGFAHTYNALYHAVPTVQVKKLVNYFIEYHAMDYAITNGYSSLIQGRAEKNGGNYDHKVGLGGKPLPLYLYRFELTSEGYRCIQERTVKKKFQTQAQIWAKLPPVIADNLGPLIRKWVY